MRMLSMVRTSAQARGAWLRLACSVVAAAAAAEAGELWVGQAPLLQLQLLPT